MNDGKEDNAAAHQQQEEVITTDQSKRIKGNNGCLVPFILMMISFLLPFFVLIGLMNGWNDALRSTIGLTMIMAGWIVMTTMSLDARLTKDGVVVQGTITDRKEEDAPQWCGCCCQKRYYIQYMYELNGMTYTNMTAWYKYVEVDDEERQQNIEIVHLPNHLEWSLPKTPGVRHHRGNAFCDQGYGIVCPSAGSLNKNASFLNYIIFFFCMVGFDVAALFAFRPLLVNDVWHTFVAHLVGVPCAYVLYYYGWMKRLEQKQQFVASETVSSMNHGDVA